MEMKSAARAVSITSSIEIRFRETNAASSSPMIGRTRERSMRPVTAAMAMTITSTKSGGAGWTKTIPSRAKPSSAARS